MPGFNQTFPKAGKAFQAAPAERNGGFGRDHHPGTQGSPISGRSRTKTITPPTPKKAAQAIPGGCFERETCSASLV
jgi:hypothetical protein